MRNWSKQLLESKPFMARKLGCIALVALWAALAASFATFSTTPAVAQYGAASDELSVEEETAPGVEPSADSNKRTDQVPGANPVH